MIFTVTLSALYFWRVSVPYGVPFQELFLPSWRTGNFSFVCFVFNPNYKFSQQQSSSNPTSRSCIPSSILKFNTVFQALSQGSGGGEMLLLWTESDVDVIHQGLGWAWWHVWCTQVTTGNKNKETCQYYEQELMSNHPCTMRNKHFGMGLRSSMGFWHCLQEKTDYIFCNMISTFPLPLSICAGLQDKGILRWDWCLQTSSTYSTHSLSIHEFRGDV